MNAKQTLSALVVASTLTFSTAAAAPTFSSEDPEIQSVWSFFLPFLNTQSEEQ